MWWWCHADSQKANQRVTLLKIRHSFPQSRFSLYSVSRAKHFTTFYNSSIEEFQIHSGLFFCFNPISTSVCWQNLKPSVCGLACGFKWNVLPKKIRIKHCTVTNTTCLNVDMARSMWRWWQQRSRKKTGYDSCISAAEFLDMGRICMHFNLLENVHWSLRCQSFFGRSRFCQQFLMAQFFAERSLEREW